MLTISEITQLLPTTPDKGLASVAIADSAQRFGSNQLTPLPREPIWRKFLEKFDEPIIKILLGAALLSMGVELFQADSRLGTVSLLTLGVVLIGAVLAGFVRWIPSILFVAAFGLFFVGLARHHVLVEGLAVMVAVVLATGVAFASEYKSDREFEALNGRKDSLRCKAMRDGTFMTLAMEEVVVGDVVVLETGDEVPGDGRLLTASELAIDQSLLTGESEPVMKAPCAAGDSADGPEQSGCVYRGTQVVDGAGRMLVAEVGDATLVGQIARQLSVDEDEPDGEETDLSRVKRKLTLSKQLTPLQQKLEKLATLISRVGYAAAALIFIVQFVHGVAQSKIVVPTDADTGVRVLGVLLSYFVNMVIIIVVAVPEGLPMSVTISLALAMRKMTRAHSLVRQLVACETIGSATVICTDKTGTLTQNKMRVVRVHWDGQTFERASTQWPGLLQGLVFPGAGQPAEWFALNGAVNSTANFERKNGQMTPVGSSTEAALLQWLQDSGLDYQAIRARFPAVYQMHFSSERKRMTTVIRRGDRLTVLAKGSPESILASCTHYQLADGTVAAWTPAARQAVETALIDAASSAMRTLALAHKVLEGPAAESEDFRSHKDALETGLVFDGFVAIQDPLRDDVAAAVAECRNAGIEVKMVTGDNVETARAIAFQIGLVDRRDAPIDADCGTIMTSAFFHNLSDDRLKQRLPALRVLARARPLDKYRLVRLLQELGEVVAVTGDGTNDAPALKKADVGLAMGIAGTEVAKEASKIVLLDDSFATIVRAVQWGRSLYENIQRFLQFQLTINVSALLTYLLGTLFFNVEAPFTVLQLLWINVIMDTFASIALCSEPPRPGVMKLPPKKRDENIVTRAMAGTIFTTAAFFVVVMLALLAAMKGNPDRPGWLGASEGPWSVEIGGQRLAVDRSDLVKRATVEAGKEHWYVREQPADPRLSDLGGSDCDLTFTVFQVSVFFSVYVFFQVWNQVNCRSLTPEVSGLSRLGSNPTFLAIAGTVAIGQIVIVTFGGSLFKVEPLDPVTWIGVIAGTSSVLVFAEIARRSRRLLRRKYALRISW
jgi:Ca2+-transporting ATPase